MKKIIILIVLVILLCGCSANNSKEKDGQVIVKNVTCKEKDDIIKNEENAMLIDVRTKEEYDEKHLEKAINIPYEKIVEELSAFGTVDFDVPVIVYCKSGGRSSMAAESLINAGYKQVYNLGAISNCD